MSYPSMLRLNPPIHVVTPLGAATANFLINESPDVLCWGVCINASNESWLFQNHQVRYAADITMGRSSTSPIAPMAGLEPHVLRNGVFAPIQEGDGR